MKRASIVLLAGSLLFATLPVSAATFLSGDTVSLSVPVTEDLYVSGGTLNIRKDVKGDLFAVGGQIDIQNAVGRSLNVAGGNVTVVSNVGGTMRVFGGQVTVRGRIGGDLLVFGGTVTVGSDAVVMGATYVSGGNLILRGVAGKDLTVKGDSVSLEGITHGNADIRGQRVTIAGPVEGNATVSAKDLAVVQGASFKGTVDYWSMEPTDFGDSLAQGQEAVFHPEFARQVPREQRGGMVGLFAALAAALTLFSLLSGALVILFGVILTRTFFTDAAKEMRRHPWKSFITGLLYVLLMPLLIIVLAISLVGFPLAIAAGACYLLTLLFAVPLSAMTLARWTEAYYKQSWKWLAFFGASVGYLLVLKIIGIVPFVGWLVKVVFVLLALGALIQTKVAKWKKIR